MASTGDGLGRVFNVINSADTLNVPLTKAAAVTFVSFLADGTQTLVFTQTDSTLVNSEIDLNIFTVGGVTAPNGESRIFAGPAIGGTWTDVTASASADNTADGATAANDTMVVTVRAEQLSDGYDQVQCSATGGATVTAILHELAVQRGPANLQSSVAV